MNRLTVKIRRLSRVALLIMIALVLSSEPYPALAVEPAPGPGPTGGEGYQQNPARLPDLLGEGLPYYIPGDACSEEVAAGGAASADGHTLPAAVGGTGFEEAINASGQVGSGGYVTFAGNVQNAPKTVVASDPEGRTMQELYRQYYITMRWRYVLWNWNGTSVSPGPEKVDFYSKAPRVLVTNKRNGKRIIAVVLEAGPAPWTGVDGGSNNNPKQGWTNPQDGTPKDYKGRVSGFPPRAIADLGATMRMRDGSGDDLIYEWAPDQNAAPGPTTPVAGTAQPSAGTNPNCASGAGGNVNTEGYSWPVADQKKHSYGTAPCNKSACHHDGTPAFDLMYGKTGNMDGKAVYAITDGTIENVDIYHGVTGCYEIQFKSNMTNGKGNYYYWYGHMQNPKVSKGAKVTAGQQIAEVGRNSLGVDCRGGRDHLHIDRGGIGGSSCDRGAPGVPQRGGRKTCRDPAFVPLMDSMWKQLQS